MEKPVKDLDFSGKNGKTPTPYYYTIEYDEHAHCHKTQGKRHNRRIEESRILGEFFVFV
jgi:hypothetical protein